MADPRLPAIPHPIADLGGLTNVATAMKQRLDNLTSYAMALKGVSATSGSGSGYTLPVASALTLGGVKIDNTTITIHDGVISATAGIGASPATAAPLMDHTPAAVGSAARYAREDHRHPVDTSRYAASNPAGYTPKSYVDGADLISVTRAAVLALTRAWFG